MCQRRRCDQKITVQLSFFFVYVGTHVCYMLTRLEIKSGFGVLFDFFTIRKNCINETILSFP